MLSNLDHNNPQNWKYGLFYYNKSDRRFIVPKLNQMMGWTFNFAHRGSWIVFATIILGAILGGLLK